MRAHSRINIANNAQYHQDLADHYTESRPPEDDARRAGAAAAPGDPDAEVRGDPGPSDHDYLAELHSEVARQLREVLDGGSPPAITGTEPPITRKVTPVVVPRARGRANAVG